jgi:hypothetical protein
MKKISLRCLIPSLSLVLTVVLAPSARADLIGHWPLDESGEDVVGGFNGVESGGVEFGVEGATAETGDATRFANGVIDVLYAEDLNPTSFTVTIWARPEGGSGHRSPFTSRYDGIVAGGGNLDGYILYEEPGNTWQFWTGDGESAADGWDSLQGPPVEEGEWQHMAVTYDEETSTKTLYVNGELVAETSDQSYAQVTDETRNLHIGGGGDLGTEFRWSGDLDDLGIWDEVLTEDDIALIMDEGIAAFASPPAGDGGFRRGDSDLNGALDITDAILNLSYQFVGDFEPPCLDALDWDDSGVIDVSDPIGSLTRQFLGGAPSPPPGSDTCGVDPTEDSLTCETGCPE